MATTTRVYASNDRLTLRLDYIVEPGMEDELIAEIVEQAASMGVEPPLQAEDVRTALAHAPANHSRISGLILRQGTPPVPPVSGKLSWQRDFFSARIVENPKTGQIDYRQRLDSSIVAANDVLATWTPPVPGTPGIDVFGKPITVPKPGGPTVRAGEGAEFAESNNTFHSTTIGRVRFAKGVIAVDTTYSVAGSIGLKTGHVNYPGSVDVAKDVEPDSIIEAGGTVHVLGAVEESVVTAGGDILVGHGVIGGGKTTLRAGGSIEAAFVERAELDAGSDIRIRRELIQCTATAQGMLHIPEGQVIGGVVNAVAGMDIGQAGSAGDVKTALISGVDESIQRAVAARRAEADECHTRIVSLKERLAPFQARESALSQAMRGRMDALLKELDKAEAHRDFVQEELRRVSDEARNCAKAEIRIRRKLFPGTHLRIAHATLTVDTEMTGPLVARLNEESALTLGPEQCETSGP